MTIAEFLLLRKPWLMSSASWSTSVSISGMMAASDPVAIAPLRARYPAVCPITSTKKSRSWLDAVSRSLSTASMIVLSAVS